MEENSTQPATPEQQARRPRADSATAPLKIGRFEVREQVGRGTYGSVYRAFDPELDREVALKVPRGIEAATRDKFVREAKAAARLSHPNVCPVYEVGTADGVPYIVSRYVSGGTLADVIAAAPNGLPPLEAVAIVLKVARGLAEAHEEQIVHRDLKPGNVLYDAKRNDYLITDFGLARLLAPGAQASGGVSGTPAYMSPEQFGDGTKAGTIGPTADVYALGVILYELLTGQQPFGTKEPLALMYAHVNTKPDPPSAVRTGIGTDVDAICQTALRKEPTERYATAAALVEALERIAREPPAARPKTTRETLAAVGSTAELAAGPPRSVGARTELCLRGGIPLPAVYCPPGTFMMGSPETEALRRADEALHRVTLARGFYMGLTPVTQAQWRAVMGTDPSHFKGDQLPVENVSWDDAVSFCEAVRAQTGTAARLPTEAEWEYAARGGTATPFYFGTALNGRQANCRGISPYGTAEAGPYLQTTTQVGWYYTSYPHPWGLCDVHGNVYEWCADGYDPGFYRDAPETDPVCDPTTSKFRVVRGGAWCRSGAVARSAYRDRSKPSFRNFAVGFRIVLPA